MKFLLSPVKKIAAVTLFIFLFSYNLHPLDTNGFIAYPVPFNPKKGDVLKIGKSGTNLVGYSVKLEVFDVNSDPVCVRNYSGTTSGLINWNGRNDRGDFVKPGLYILKLTYEYNADGDFAKKIIKIVVKY